MAEKKQRSPMPRRFRYAELYRAEPVLSASGKLVTENVYIGAYLLPSHGENVYARSRRSSRALSVCNLICLVLLLSVNGFFFYSGGRYVMIPLAGALIPGVYLLLGAFRLPREDRKLQKDTYRFAHIRIRASAIAEGVLWGVFAVLFVLSLCLPGRPAFTAVDLLFALLAVLSVLSCAETLFVTKKLRYEERGE